MEKEKKKTLTHILKDEIPEIISFMEENKLREMEIEEDGKKVRIRRNYFHHEKKKEETKGENKLSVVPVNSQLVGIFRLDSTDESIVPIKEGDEVIEGQTLCFIESMGLLHHVKSPARGFVVEILASDGDVVEYGQPIINIQI